MTDTSRNFKWGDQEIAPNDIPVENLFALAQQGLNHKRGNEVSAARVAWLKTDDGATADEAAIQAWVDAKTADMLDKVLSRGKYDGVALGVRASSGPRVSGEEALRRNVTLTVLKAFLAKHNLKMPTGEGVIKVAGKDMTREMLIEAMYRKDKASIDAEVERKKAFEESAASGADIGDVFGDQ